MTLCLYKLIPMPYGLASLRSETTYLHLQLDRLYINGPRIYSVHCAKIEDQTFNRSGGLTTHVDLTKCLIRNDMLCIIRYIRLR